MGLDKVMRVRVLTMGLVPLQKKLESLYSYNFNLSLNLSPPIPPPPHKNTARH